MVATMDPEYPDTILQGQPVGKSIPMLFVFNGQATGMQDPEKKRGLLSVAINWPLNPALHRQPLGKFVPELFIGQLTAVHV